MGGVVMYGVGYRVNSDAFNDPAKFGLFYHSALLFRSGHVAPAKKSVGLMLQDTDIYAVEKNRLQLSLGCPKFIKQE